MMIAVVPETELDAAVKWLTLLISVTAQGMYSSFSLTDVKTHLSCLLLDAGSVQHGELLRK